MKKIIVVSLLCISHIVFASENKVAESQTINDNNNFTLYLVRHAEKRINDKDPELTECGIKRAEHIATLLSKTNIERVYSTSYKRTLATAKPSAELFKLTTQIYEPSDLSRVASLLINNKQTALVVGHSNTTPQLASLLSHKKINEMTELEYQRLYQIQIRDNTPIITELTQTWVCDKSN